MDPLSLEDPDGRLVARAWIAGVGLALLYLAVALPRLGDYGPTWDCVMGEYPYGERLLEYLHTGNREFLELESYQPAPTVRSPHPDFNVGRFATCQVFPFGALLSALSCRWLWTEAGLVPALAAHNLPIPLLTAGLLLVLVRFAAPRIGLLAACAGSFLAACAPCFFAHTFNNLKDIPETSLYVSATCAAFLALTTGRTAAWVAAGALTGLALAQKANALFIPVQMAAFLGAGLAFPGLRRGRCFRWSTRGLLLGALAFVAAHVAVSPGYWSAPIQAPRELLREILRVGNRGFDADASEATVSTHALLFVATTTPPLLLGLGCLGLCAPRIRPEMRLFLLAGLAVPIGRNLLPGMNNYGGVRHYIEFYPYLGLAAGVGLIEVARFVSWLAGRLPGLPQAHARAAAGAVVIGSTLGWHAFQTLALHPNGICYFNSFIGGLAGAQRWQVPGATDYWGNSYWQGLAWLDEHAEPGSTVVAPIASQIVRSAVPVRLRPDLRLWTPAFAHDRTIYLMYITRQGWYRPVIRWLEKNARPAHEILVQGGAILRIYRLGDDEQGREAYRLWEREIESKEEVARLVAWLREHRDVLRQLTELTELARKVGTEQALERMRPLVPAEFHGALGEALWGRIAE